MSAAGVETSPAVCAPCHRAQTANFAAAAMTRALARARDSAILKADPKLTARLGPYAYEIVRSGDESILTVTDGHDVLRIPIEWTFGQTKP